MLFLLRGKLTKPDGMSNKEFYGIWQKEAEALVEEELVGLGLLKMSQIKKQPHDEPAFKKYFMHGIGHPLGLDVHGIGLTVAPIQPGWVLTVEPAIYIPEEGFGVRLENDILIQEGRNVDLMENVPIEAEEIEQLMSKKKRATSLHTNKTRFDRRLSTVAGIPKLRQSDFVTNNHL